MRKRLSRLRDSPWLPDLMLVTGCILVAVGIGMKSLAAGIAVAGVEMAVLGVLTALGGEGDA